MKLILCPKCQDVVKLKPRLTECQCKKSWGYYKEDLLHAVIGGDAIPLGILNNTLVKAMMNNKLKDDPKNYDALYFTAFVIGQDCKTIERKK